MFDSFEVTIKCTFSMDQNDSKARDARTKFSSSHRAISQWRAELFFELEVDPGSNVHNEINILEMQNPSVLNKLSKYFD